MQVGRGGGVVVLVAVAVGAVVAVAAEAAIAAAAAAAHFVSGVAVLFAVIGNVSSDSRWLHWWQWQ